MSARSMFSMAALRKLSSFPFMFSHLMDMSDILALQRRSFALRTLLMSGCLMARRGDPLHVHQGRRDPVPVGLWAGA